MHLKNVRPEIVRRARPRKYSFDRAVKEGVFTVPGDGGISYKPIFEVLKEFRYEGWMVVEAEQDPKKQILWNTRSKGAPILRSLPDYDDSASENKRIRSEFLERLV